MNLDAFIRQHQLPAEFAASATRCFLPYAKWLDRCLESHVGGAFVLGINGAQGSGKSTLAGFIAEYLAARDRKVAVLSLDDVYLTRVERDLLAEQVHPLLGTRGVPGTHDVSLGLATVKALQELPAGKSASVPSFDKAQDDRRPARDWPIVTGPIDLVILEGWCVGSLAVPQSDLADPINELEATKDADGRWRSYVNQQLATDYRSLFALIDSLLYLQVPDFRAVLDWRIEQEQKLRRGAAGTATAVMSDEQVAEFIQLFERITRDNIASLPSTADAVIGLDDSHAAVSLRFAADGPPR